MTDYEKALMNAIIHDGFNPNLKEIKFRCDKCGCPVFYIPVEHGRGLPDGRIQIYIVQCPACGAKELDCIGTYYLPDYLPGTILPFIGHFLTFMALLHEHAVKLDRRFNFEEEKIIKEGHFEKGRWIE